MRKLFIFPIMIILLSGYASCVFAEEKMSDADRAKLGLGLSLSSLKKYDESIEILKDLHNRFPDDKMIDVELINSLYEAGMDKEADERTCRCIETKITRYKTCITVGRNSWRQETI